MTTADDILEMLRDDTDMVEHGFFVQCVADGGGIFTLESRVEDLLAELLSSGKVEIGEAKQFSPGASEFVAWRGTVPERIRRAGSAVSNAVGHDKQFAYWLCLREKVDRYE
jgi:hypothetical protein